MCEVGSSLTYPLIREEVAQWLYQTGYSSSPSSGDRVDIIVDRGFRLFMAPPIRPDETRAHTWSWINPATTKDVAADLLGTLTTAAPTSTALVASAAKFLTAPLAPT